MDVVIEGFPAFLRQLDAMEREIVGPEVGNIMASAVTVTHAEIMARAPVQDKVVWKGPRGSHQAGTLKTDWRIVQLGVTNGKHRVAIQNSAKSYYAAWVEYGHYVAIRLHKFGSAVSGGVIRTEDVADKSTLQFVPAHPFIRPALYATRDRVTAAFAQGVLAVLRRAR